MKPVFDTQTGSIYTRTVRSFSMVMILTMLAAVIIVSFSSSSAWSFEAYHGHLNDRIVDTPSATVTHASYHSSKLKTSSILADSHTQGAADTCLPLLTSIRHTSPQNAMDRSQRSAGKAAAVGLIFGVRFALTPPEMAQKTKKAKASLNVWQPEPVAQDRSNTGNRSALAVAAYRQCQKQQALQALNARWSR